MRARREKGLCYNCDEQFLPGHRCKKSHMFFLMTEEEEAEYVTQTHNEIDGLVPQEPEVEISFNAMTGSFGVNTIKVQGLKGKHKLNIFMTLVVQIALSSNLLHKN